jgi:subtilisin family serine protease
MTINYRSDDVLIRIAEFRPGDIGRLNQLLDSAGLKSRLGDPPDGPPGEHATLISVPVHGGEGDAGPSGIEAAVRSAQADGQAVPTVLTGTKSIAGTLVRGTFFEAAGKKSGHGMGWVPSPLGELPDAPPWTESAPHPVVAVLDSGVQPHHWLKNAPSFLVHEHVLDGWPRPLPPDNPASKPYPPGTHWGHGTFIAGLIRRTAPNARVLSMRVMNSKGIVQDVDAINALNWLAGHRVADIVLMAFGRQANSDDPLIHHDLRDAVKALAHQDERVRHSAGNKGSDLPVYPAAFAAELGPKVISVGAAMSREFRAPYSNHGSWVTAGWLGTDIVSIHPQTIHKAGFHQTGPSDIDNPVSPVAEDSCAWWSGTSFAAAIAAGHLANKQAAGVVPMPEKVQQP